MLDYIRDAAEIYRQSFATVRAEADLSRFPAAAARVGGQIVLPMMLFATSPSTSPSPPTW